jgi:hypothetical protein
MVHFSSLFHYTLILNTKFMYVAIFIEHYNPRYICILIIKKKFKSFSLKLSHLTLQRRHHGQLFWPMLIPF